MPCGRQLAAGTLALVLTLGLGDLAWARGGGGGRGGSGSSSGHSSSGGGHGGTLHSGGGSHSSLGGPPGSSGSGYATSPSGSGRHRSSAGTGSGQATTASPTHRSAGTPRSGAHASRSQTGSFRDPAAHRPGRPGQHHVTPGATDRNVPQALKDRVYREAGIPKSAQKDYVIDHKIPLALGGSNARSNLQPMHHQEAKAKDRVENYLASQVRQGKMSQAEAQRQIQNWRGVEVPRSFK